MKGLLIGICLFALAVPAPAQTDMHALVSALEQGLKGNVLLLRGFPIQSDLRFDPDLKPEKTYRSGSWTEAEFKVDAVEMKGNNVVLSGQRSAFVRDSEKGPLVKVLVLENKKFDATRKIKITINGPFNDAPADFLDKVKKRIFITDFNELKTIAPPWWQPYLRGELPTKAKPHGEETFGHLDNGDPIYKVGKGAASAPKPIKSPDPDYTDIARVAKFQGVSVLSAVVLPTGDVAEIKVETPLGMGLDDNAVAAVQTWKFKPAMRDGSPVAVKINIEVSFNLY